MTKKRIIKKRPKSEITKNEAPDNASGSSSVASEANVNISHGSESNLSRTRDVSICLAFALCALAGAVTTRCQASWKGMDIPFFSLESVALTAVGMLETGAFLGSAAAGLGVGAFGGWYTGKCANAALCKVVGFSALEGISVLPGAIAGGLVGSMAGANLVGQIWQAATHTLPFMQP
jgi:hypothetical protein